MGFNDESLWFYLSLVTSWKIDDEKKERAHTHTHKFAKEKQSAKAPRKVMKQNELHTIEKWVDRKMSEQTSERIEKCVDLIKYYTRRTTSTFLSTLSQSLYSFRWFFHESSFLFSIFFAFFNGRQCRWDNIFVVAFRLRAAQSFLKRLQTARQISLAQKKMTTNRNASHRFERTNEAGHRKEEQEKKLPK